MFDYLIVGGGSAGCLLAHELTRDPDVRVCLLEAGGSGGARWARMPGATGFLMHHPGYCTRYRAARLTFHAGRGLGGSGAINALVHCRGADADYTAWAQAGGSQWEPTALQPHFSALAKALHADAPARFAFPVSGQFLDAASAAGLDLHARLDHCRAGAGAWPCTIHEGQRYSPVDAWLRPAMARPNLVVRTGFHVHRLLLDGDQAVGVVGSSKNSGRESVFCSREVILSAGTFRSPQILMHSGIGDPEVLAAAGIRTRHVLPGVGANLQDHPDISISFRATTGGYSFGPGGMLRGATCLARYLIRGDGPFAHAMSEVGAFLHSGADTTAAPDLQCHFLPMRFDAHGRDLRLMTGSGFSARLSLLDATARGRLLPTDSTRPDRSPRILYDPLACEHDLERLVCGVEQVSAILARPELGGRRAVRLRPTIQCQSREALAADVRNRCSTIYHPVGTCSMGRQNEEHAVVNGDLRVHGMSGLRVVDASIMPMIPRANTQASVLAVAAVAAEQIRADT